MTTVHSRSGIPLTAMAAVSALALLTACGSSSSGAAPAASNAGSTAAASSAAGPAEKKTIVFSPIGLQIPSMKGLSEGVKGYAGSMGFEVLVQDPALDPAKQATDLQSVVESGRVAGAYAIVLQADAVKPIIAEAQKRKIPLVLSGSAADYGLTGPGPGLSFTTIDYANQGKALGEELGRCINEKLGGKAEVIMQIGPAGGVGDEASQKAAKDALAATAPGAKIVQTVTVRDRTGAQTDMGNALQGKPNVTAVLGNNDEGALGALGAFAAAGKKLACVTEVGGNEEVLAKVKDGTIYAVVAMQFGEDMTQSVDTLAKMIADPTSTGVQLVVPQKVVKAGS